MTAIPKLPLAAMHTRHDGLTEATANYYFEAARVCLDRHHESPREIEIDSNGTKSPVVADWEPPDDRTRGAWANEIDATEDGAYACALAAAEVSEGLVAVYRAETGTGADWYIAPKGKTVEDLEDCLRFEVSGVDCGNEIAVAQRLKKKLKQTAAGDSNLPAMAGVVGFKAALVMLETLED